MLQIDKLRLHRDGYVLDANLRIENAGPVSILGPSGAGKSTLLALIGGFEAASSGSIFWRDEELTDKAPFERPASHIFQDNNLFPNLTAKENVGLGIKASLKLSDEDWRVVNQALERTGLHGLADRKPGALSGGQQSRVALARILVQRQPLVLLDEPFSALGPAMRIDMTDLAKEVIEELGATALLVSHDLEDAKRFSDYVIWVADGVVNTPVRWSEIEADPPASFTAYVGQTR